MDGLNRLAEAMRERIKGGQEYGEGYYEAKVNEAFQNLNTKELMYLLDLLQFCMTLNNQNTE